MGDEENEEEVVYVEENKFWKFTGGLICGLILGVAIGLVVRICFII